MVVYSTILQVDYDRAGDTGGANVKTWIDAQTGSTVNWCSTSHVGKGLVLVVIDKT